MRVSRTEESGPAGVLVRSRIICLNNYPLGKMALRCARGETPRQHLWAVDALMASGADVDLAPFAEPWGPHLTARLSWRLSHRAGCLDQELYAARRRPDLIYAADQASARGLAAVPRWLRRVPVITTLHHPHGHVLPAQALRNADGVVFLSERLQQECLHLRPGRPGVVAPWGPDLTATAYSLPSDERLGVVSVGKSNRDLGLLVGVLGDLDLRGTVYDVGRSLGRPPPSVELVHGGGAGADEGAGAGFVWRRVAEDIRSASVVAIPVLDPLRLTGLTEVNDALAFGKPIVMTRSPYFPFDLEDVGCGVVVDPGDAEGWRRALRRLSSESARAEMGARGRAFAEERWNYSAYTSAVLGLVEDVLTAS